MKAYPILIPYQTDKELMHVELIQNSGRLREREAFMEAIEQLCTCESRKVYACTCEVYVKDLIKMLKGDNK